MLTITGKLNVSDLSGNSALGIDLPALHIDSEQCRWDLAHVVDGVFSALEESLRKATSCLVHVREASDQTGIFTATLFSSNTDGGIADASVRSRIENIGIPVVDMVAGAGFEPATSRL